MINIVLYEPEIPQNTGNIMRTCVATDSKLHLIKPLGFSLEEKHLKRSGLDYVKDLKLEQYENWIDFKEKNKGVFIYITRYGKKPHSDFDFSNIDEEIYLIFGKESTGIPKDILKENLEYCFRLPMVNDIRSLNLSNCVAVVTYEVLRQKSYLNLSKTETIKGEDWLIK
ncbi:MAG: tRNA (cytidine(34)-2'-O)-methyltransferase [Erysipelotrichaceae bacterium]|jgi:tRNA (cytidine/uridine-2'-O-)-methyltransferase|nr:tRNA (cytidine(34)-2'-O)-methyltransferase [Bacillota bacterium]NLP21850.1 tRNA (cytidine(34)-2'-O)-methyltransferase [Erysipelotrichaceae bacterium]